MFITLWKNVRVCQGELIPIGILQKLTNVCFKITNMHSVALVKHGGTALFCHQAQHHVTSIDNARSFFDEKYPGCICVVQDMIFAAQCNIRNAHNVVNFLPETWGEGWQKDRVGHWYWKRYRTGLMSDFERAFAIQQIVDENLARRFPAWEQSAGHNTAPNHGST